MTAPKALVHPASQFWPPGRRGARRSRAADNLNPPLTVSAGHILPATHPRPPTHIRLPTAIKCRAYITGPSPQATHSQQFTHGHLAPGIYYRPLTPGHPLTAVHPRPLSAGLILPAAHPRPPTHSSSRGRARPSQNHLEGGRNALPKAGPARRIRKEGANPRQSARTRFQKSGRRSSEKRNPKSGRDRKV